MPTKLISLTQPINSQTPVYPDDPQPELKLATTIHEAGYRLSQLQLGTHCGTHIDAPAHILEKGHYLNNYAPEKFIGPAIKIFCANSIITQKDISTQLPENKNYDFILLETNWDTQWQSARYFTHAPILSKEAAELLATLSLKGLGMDFPSVDSASSHSNTNHRILLEEDVLLIENLCHLELLPQKDFIFTCQPLITEKADGSPVYAMAIISPDNE